MHHDHTTRGASSSIEIEATGPAPGIPADVVLDLLEQIFDGRTTTASRPTITMPRPIADVPPAVRRPRPAIDLPSLPRPSRPACRVPVTAVSAVASRTSDDHVVVCLDAPGIELGSMRVSLVGDRLELWIARPADRDAR